MRVRRLGRLLASVPPIRHPPLSQAAVCRRRLPSGARSGRGPPPKTRPVGPSAPHTRAQMPELAQQRSAPVHFEDNAVASTAAERPPPPKSHQSVTLTWSGVSQTGPKRPPRTGDGDVVWVLLFVSLRSLSSSLRLGEVSARGCYRCLLFRPNLSSSSACVDVNSYCLPSRGFVLIGDGMY
jgi:hypothetical protein